MNAFRYQAIEGSGAAVNGVIEAEDRKTALQLLGERGLFPSNLEVAAAGAAAARRSRRKPKAKVRIPFRTGRQAQGNHRVHAGDGRALGSGDSIPQALDGLERRRGQPGLQP
jgi:hypothetical protein